MPDEALTLASLFEQAIARSLGFIALAAAMVLLLEAILLALALLTQRRGQHAGRGRGRPAASPTAPR